MRGLIAAVVVLGLIACLSSTFAAMLWWRSRAVAAASTAAEVQAVPAPVATAPVAVATKPAADTAALQEQLASKERIIERLQQELRQAQRPAPVTTERTEQRALRTEGQPGRGFDMERLRTEDPERYAEIRERMKAMTEQLNSAANKRSQFIAGLDANLVKQEDQENLAKLQDGMKKMAELTAQMQQAQANGTELAPEVRREMWELSRELQPLMGVARTAALTDLALQLGYKREAAGEFVEYVNELVEQTSLGGGMMGRGGWGGGPGGNTGRDGGSSGRNGGSNRGTR